MNNFEKIKSFSKNKMTDFCMPYCVVLVVFQKSTTVKNVWQKVYVMLIEKEIVDTVSHNGYKRKARGRNEMEIK